MPELARSVREAQRRLGAAEGARRSASLTRLAALLDEHKAALLDANREDMVAAEKGNLAPPLLRRLELTEAKLQTLAEGVSQLARWPDPIGKELRRTELDSGLVLRKVQSPLGVLLIIFESRPDAVIQIGSLAMRSGNGVILKGGAEATQSNRALVDCLREALADEGLPADAVRGVEGREPVAELLQQDDDIDLVIPRGSGRLVRSIQSSTRIPVLGHAEGICHLYVDGSADPAMARRLAVDGKCDYPAACNATETLLVHRAFLPHLTSLGRALTAAGVELRADDDARAVLEDARPAAEEDWSTEYGAPILAVRTVAGLDDAIEHIHRYGSAHTDAVVAEDEQVRRRFLREVDSASVFANASTRFADGFRYGLGAEVGISTSRIHARGPVGVDGLLTSRWLLEGQGQVAGDYGSGKRSFTHRTLPPDD
ncbi:MAG: glutamate-5-semialdehyde dehydrogenase [bacterium]|nr:glutamate-5-semialdehyde dehydrogenase [bacterium]